MTNPSLICNLTCNGTEQVKKGLAHLRKIDGKLAQIIDEIGPDVSIQRRGEPFEVLCRSIVGQQLSTKVAHTIFARLEKLADINPESIHALDPDQIRGIGLSGRKVEYLGDLAEKFKSGQVTERKLKKLDDQEVVTLLMQIRGIGPWTAEMLLMFSLGRLDVFSVDDLGIRKAMEKLYNEGKPIPKKDLIEIADRWTPYRTIGCLYLWKWYDGIVEI